MLDLCLGFEDGEGQERKGADHHLLLIFYIIKREMEFNYGETLTDETLKLQEENEEGFREFSLTGRLL